MTERPNSGVSPLLDVESLRVSMPNGGPVLLADCSLTIRRGETLGLVGESGSGKTMFGRAVMDLLPTGAAVQASRLRLAGDDLLTMPAEERRQQRGSTVAMVFQDPMTSLNPFLRVRTQLAEMLPPGLKPAERRHQIEESLRSVRLPDPRRCADAFPHALSGGMRQRVLIAMMLLGKPALLIADEPTTALDVTVAARILALFAELASRRELALLFISHDIAAVGSIADRIAVMYAGEVVEVASTERLLNAAQHPYTQALLASRPASQPVGQRLRTIAGFVPSAATSSGCAFAPRCARADQACTTAKVPLEQASGGGLVRCIRPGEASAS